MNSINIFQQNWAFTTVDAKKHQITTGSFGPCYVLTFTSEKFAAMAHIDDVTRVDSIQDIFDKFIENTVALKDVKVIILGGWKEHPKSFKWGNKIKKKITEAGFVNIRDEKMFSKIPKAVVYSMSNLSTLEVAKSHHFGALVDARTGKTFLLKEINMALERKQEDQMRLFFKQYGPAIDVELPISQVL